jgi:hypothetical protein
MLRILEHILRSYDDLISERLSHHRGVMTPSKRRKGLGRHVRKGDPEGRFCRGRRIRKRGFRKQLRTIATVFGKLRLPIWVAECCHCRARYSPLLDALKLMPYSRKQSNFEHEVIEAVIGVTAGGQVELLGTFANISWDEIERVVKERLKITTASGIPFIYDGEPGLDNFLADVAQSQRCAWHGPRGLYHSLWEDGLKKKDSQPQIDKLKHLIGIELPQGDYQLLKDEDRELVEEKYRSSKAEIVALIELFKDKGYHKGAVYLENLSRRIFTNIEIWLKTGVIAPRTISLLERIFREIGRRIKRIAWGWSDATVTKLSKMIILKKYSKEKWERYWKRKLGIDGNFKSRLKRSKLVDATTFERY